MEISRIIELAEERGFTFHEYEEKGVVCGYEVESWTDNGVNMIHFIDCRNDRHPAGLNAENVLEELKEIAAFFSVDREIDLHRLDDHFRMAFSIRQALNDFDNYEKHLTEFVRAVQEEFDFASTKD